MKKKALLIGFMYMLITTCTLILLGTYLSGCTTTQVVEVGTQDYTGVYRTESGYWANQNNQG